MNAAILALSLFTLATSAEIGPDFTKQRGTEANPKHTPKLTAPKQVNADEWFEVKISVGKDAVHPSTEADHVRFIALLADGVEITRVYLHPTMAKPEVTLVIALPDDRTFDAEGNVKSHRDRVVTLRAVEAPNHSSEWWIESQVTVKAKR